MPGLKGRDMSAGPWLNPRRRGGRISTTLCDAGCGHYLHDELILAGATTHPTCDPPPAEPQETTPE